MIKMQTKPEQGVGNEVVGLNEEELYSIPDKIPPEKQMLGNSQSWNCDRPCEEGRIICTEIHVLARFRKFNKWEE